MKGAISLFFCALMISSSFCASVAFNVADTVQLALCISSSCNVLSILSNTTTLSASDDVTLDTDLLVTLTGTLNMYVDDAIIINSLVISGAKAAVFTINTGASVTTATLSITTSKTVDVVGNLTVSTSASVQTQSALVVNGTANLVALTVDSSSSLAVQTGAYVTVSSTSVVSSSLNFAQSSTFVVASGTLTAGAAVVGYGTTIVQGVFNAASSSYTQAQGFLILSSSASVQANINANVNLNGASYFKGTGNITGNFNVNANGTIAVGNSPGTAYVNGNMAMSSTSTFELDIASSSSYDRVIVTGSVSVDGILYCHLANSYAPSSGETYTFISSGGTVSGTFNIVRGDDNSYIDKFTQGEQTHGVTATYNSASAAAASIFMLIAAFFFAAL